MASPLFPLMLAIFWEPSVIIYISPEQLISWRMASPLFPLMMVSFGEHGVIFYNSPEQRIS